MTLGGPRAYAKGSTEIFQVLEVLTGYDFSDAFTISARQRMEVRERKRLDTVPHTVIRDRTRLEFTGGMDLDHQFREEFSVRASIQRTQSSLEKNYWRISVTANRSF